MNIHPHDALGSIDYHFGLIGGIEMESRMNIQSKTYEEKVEVAARLTRELFNSELFKVLVERERQIGSGGGSAERPAPRWFHTLIDAIWEYFTD